MNRGSGHDDKDEAADAIRAVLEGAGLVPGFLRLDPDQPIDAQIDEALRAAGEPGVVVAAGGDGTLNAVAGAAMKAGWTLGVVPMGTFNSFARDLEVPLQPAEAARTLVESAPRAVPVARVNGRLFLNNASFGLYPKLLEEGEALKERIGRYRWVAVLGALRTLATRRRAYHLRISVDGQPANLVTQTLLFTVNALQLENLHLDPGIVHDGKLAVIAPSPASPPRLLWLALRAALRGVDDPEELTCLAASRVRVEWPGHATARIAVDGEILETPMPLEVVVEPGALTVLAPRGRDGPH